MSETQEAASGTLGARATDLRRAVNASRARLGEQRREAERLRAELAALAELGARALAAKPAVPETVSDSARVGAVSGAAGRRSPAQLALPIAALTLFVAGQQIGLYLQRPPAPAPRQERPSRPPLPPLEAAAPSPDADALDEGAQKALVLAAAWREPEDGRTLDERFGPAVDLPAASPTWQAERTGERSYRVTRLSPSGDEFAFDVDLSLDRASPEPDTRRRLSPRYVAMRGADDASPEP